MKRNRSLILSLICILGIICIYWNRSKAAVESAKWSHVIQGLQGRLLINSERLNPGAREAITLELRNVSLRPISITNQPRFKARLFDSAGREIPQSKFQLMSGPIPLAETAVIPRDAYLGFRVNMQRLPLFRTKPFCLQSVGLQQAIFGTWLRGRIRLKVL